MNNFEKIKSMDIDEMAELFDDWGFISNISKSIDGIKQWLESEVRE